MIDNKTIRKVIMLNKMLPGGSPTYEDREASGAVANFTTNTVQPFVKCECEILPIQEGTGTPSPSNPRPISGTDELMLTHTNYRTAETYTFDLGQEIIGGTADCVGGTGEITSGYGKITDLATNYFYSTSNKRWEVSGIPNLKSFPSRSIEGLLSDIWQPNAGAYTGDEGVFFTVNGVIYFYTSNSDSLDGNIVYPLATPTEFSFTGQPINSYLGVNNVWTKAGDTKVTYKYKTGEGGSSNKKYLPIFYDIYGKEKYK